MSCYNCGRGFHAECVRRKGCKVCHPKVIELSSTARVLTGASRGAPVKEPGSVKDPHSTGRKRAAQLYPIFPEQDCEWKGKKNCGGGLKPITGCLFGKQRDRHHGPVKNTLRNEPGQVHRICSQCHNRWHYLNNPVYDEKLYDTLPHKPEEATPEDLVQNELFWKDKKVNEARDY